MRTSRREGLFDELDPHDIRMATWFAEWESTIGNAAPDTINPAGSGGAIAARDMPGPAVEAPVNTLTFFSVVVLAICMMRLVLFGRLAHTAK